MNHIDFTRRSVNRRETIMNKTLSIIKEKPGLDGAEIVALYRPAAEVIHALSKQEKIVWSSGWKIKVPENA